MTCEGPDIPWACIHHTKSGHLVSVYEDNSAMQTKVAQYSLPSIKKMTVPVSGSDQKAHVKLFYPPNFDPSRKYPMVVYVYGGPGSQSVDDQWKLNSYQTYLSGTHEVIYAIIDPMGSGYQGDDWLFSVYKGFGTVEVKSTIEVTKYLQDTLDHVDATRTGIWGWSYGGYLSLSVLIQDVSGVFKCGGSVAPVTDWTLYDTYYTERYMGLLTDNEEGYTKSRVLEKLLNLKTGRKKFLVMHGTRDDNVHLQQSMLLAAALERYDILFRQQLYPDQDHSIPSYHQHLYHTITDFFVNDCFRDNNEDYFK